MINRIIIVLILVPLAVILIALSVANREMMSLTIDPFNPGNPRFPTPPHSLSGSLLRLFSG